MNTGERNKMKRLSYNFRRTKIVCTIGPATGSPALIRALIKAGMNVARLNLSHGSFTEHSRYIRLIRETGERLGIEVAILMDLPGPKYRTGRLKGGKAVLKKGATVVLSTRQIEGDASVVSVNLPELYDDIKKGDMVLVDDGAMRLRVSEKEDGEVKCRVIVGGMLTENRGLVVPGMRTSGPYLIDALKEGIKFAIEQRPDYLALSFVSNSEDIKSVRNILGNNDADIPIIAKIERRQAVADFNNILLASDGIMVARGDLGVDIPLEKVPLAQKEIIRKCNRAGKPVITATQMLESMVNAVLPTRAEVADVANAIFDGTDATMLSAETSIGHYPLESVKMMVKITREAEKRLPYERLLQERSNWIEQETDEVISYNACLTAQQLGASAIVAFTQSGNTAGRVSKYRPRTPVLAISPSSSVVGRSLLRWGVIPLQIDPIASVDKLFSVGSRLCQQLRLAKPGDLIVITGGIPVGQAGATNLLKVQTVD
jgi:pyruvate kinase